MSDLLESLGLSREAMATRVAERVAEQLLAETGGLWAVSIRDSIRKQINEAIDTLAREHILPRVTGSIDGMMLQETNKWGEAMGSPKSFIEYIVSRAESYLQEPVNFKGEPAGKYDSSKQTRLTHLVHEHLHYAIDSAMKDATKTVNANLATALAETVKLKMTEIVKRLRVDVNL